MGQNALHRTGSQYFDIRAAEFQNQERGGLTNPQSFKETDLPQEINIINLSLPLNLGSVNCYLVKNEAGFILIDTGGSNKRRDLETELESAGCQPGNLDLVVLTHGDFDHTGNAAYLRKKFGTKIAMHSDDSGMAEQGDMFWNRNKPNFLIKMMTPILLRFPRSDWFEADIFIEDGSDLSEYGFVAKVIYIPGHSKGSIGILTNGGDLFCGDLLENTDKPALNSIMDDVETANTSVEKLKGYKINTVYPGHGKSFPMDQFMENHLKKLRGEK
jgi:glyoxylase-like metal-dependent hydrolase (beta-lactamase superfamily II)